MIELKKFIEETLEEYKDIDTTMIEFDLGLLAINKNPETVIYVDSDSTNRVKFTVNIRNKN